MSRYGWMAATLALLAGPALAGDPAAEGPALQFEIAVPGPMGEGPGDHIVMMRAEESFEAQLVKGAPYTAEAVHEFVQTLADGNRIVRRSASPVARDGEGRTRREHGLAAIGPMLAGAPEHRSVFIHDPVAGVSWILEPEQKVARKLTRVIRGAVARPGAPGAAPGSERHVERIVIRRPGGETTEQVSHGGGPLRSARLPKPETESLGTRTIEGVEATGTRTVVTIPAGDLGNERPLEIVTERWYSPELKAVVLSRHSDPRMGETSFRLTQVNRGEPDRALFEVPSDYTVKEGGPGHEFRIEKRRGQPRN